MRRREDTAVKHELGVWDPHARAVARTQVQVHPDAGGVAQFGLGHFPHLRDTI